jgi:hypothetical protein
VCRNSGLTAEMAARKYQFGSAERGVDDESECAPKSCTLLTRAACCILWWKDNVRGGLAVECFLPSPPCPLLPTPNQPTIPSNYLPRKLHSVRQLGQSATARGSHEDPPASRPTLARASGPPKHNSWLGRGDSGLPKSSFHCNACVERDRPG